jgi:hypothetical protein
MLAINQTGKRKKKKENVTILKFCWKIGTFISGWKTTQKKSHGKCQIWYQCVKIFKNVPNLNMCFFIYSSPQNTDPGKAVGEVQF